MSWHQRSFVDFVWEVDLDLDLFEGWSLGRFARLSFLLGSQTSIDFELEEYFCNVPFDGVGCSQREGKLNLHVFLVEIFRDRELPTVRWSDRVHRKLVTAYRLHAFRVLRSALRALCETFKRELIAQSYLGWELLLVVLESSIALKFTWKVLVQYLSSFENDTVELLYKLDCAVVAWNRSNDLVLQLLAIAFRCHDSWRFLLEPPECTRVLWKLLDLIRQLTADAFMCRAEISSQHVSRSTVLAFFEKWHECRLFNDVWDSIIEHHIKNQWKRCKILS